MLAKRRAPPLNIGYNDYGIEASRKVLYRNFHEISEKVYLVEVSRTTKKMLIILLENFEEPQNYLADAFTLK